MKISNTSERLRQVMSERNLRQVDILRLTEPYCKLYDVKMNKSDISQYCSGKVEPNQDKLFILSTALKVNVSWLMGYDVPSEPAHFEGAKRDYCIYKSLEEGLRSFNWDIAMQQIDDEHIQYFISNGTCSITVPEENVTNIESKLKQFFIKELKDIFIKQNNLLFSLNDNETADDSMSMLANSVQIEESKSKHTNIVKFTDIKEAKQYLEGQQISAFATSDITDAKILEIANAIYNSKNK